MPVIRERQTFTEDGKKKDTLQGRVNNKQILVNDGDKTGNSTDTYMSKPLPKNATESKKSIGSKVVDFIKSKNEEPKTNLLSWIDNSKRTGAKAYDLLQSISDYGQKISDNDDYVDMMRLKNAKQKKEEKEKKKLTDPYYNLPSYVSEEDAKQYRIDNTNKALDKMESDANKNGDLTMADVVYDNNGNFELVNYQKDIQNLDKTLKDYQKQLQQIATESNPYGFDYNGVMQQDYANKTQKIQSLYDETKRDYDELVRRQRYQDAIVGRWALDYAIENNDDISINDLYKSFASYDDDFVSRRLKNLGNVPLKVASSIATVSDVVRDLAGEERARQIEEKATKMLHDGKITNDEFNDLLSKAKDFSDFDATNKELLSSQLREISNQIAYDVANGEDGVGKFIGQGLDSTVDFVAQFFLLGPQNSLLSMATQSGSQKYFENLEKGYSKDIAFLNALATGAISYYVEKMNVDNFVAILNGTVGQSVFAQALNAMAQGKGNLGVWGRNIMSQGLSEFAEEGIEGNLDYGLDWLTAKMFNGEPVEYNPGDIFYNMLIGGFSGLLTGTVGNSYNIVVNTRAQYNSLRNDVNSLIQIRNEAVMKGEDVTNINKAIQTGELALNSFEEKSQTMAVTLPSDLVDDNLTPQGVKQELTDVLRPQVDQAVQQTLNQEEVVNRIYDMSQQFLSYKGINAPVQEFTNMPAQQRQAVMLASEFFKSNNIKNAFTRLMSGQNGLIVKDGILINTDQSKTIDIDALADLDEDTYGKIDKATNAIFEKENAGADPSATTSVAHEVSHYAEKSGLWENLRNTVRDMMGSERFEIAKTRINDIYSARNVKNADAETEVVAFFIQKNLGNTEFLQRLSSYNNSLLSRLYSDVKAMFSGDEKVKLENTFEKVFRDAQSLNEVNNYVNSYQLSFGANDNFKDSDGETVPKNLLKYLEGSKLTNGSGELLRIYHTSPKFFTEFNPTGSPYYRFGDKVVNYYSTNSEVSGSYTDGIFNQIKNAEDIKAIEDTIPALNKLEKELTRIEKDYKKYAEAKRNEAYQIAMSDNFRNIAQSVKEAIQNYDIENGNPLMISVSKGFTNKGINNYAIDLFERTISRILDASMIADTSEAILNLLKDVNESLNRGRWSGTSEYFSGLTQEAYDIWEPLLSLPETKDLLQIKQDITDEYTKTLIERDKVNKLKEKINPGKQYVGYGKSINPYILENTNDYKVNWNSLNELNYSVPQDIFNNITNDVVDVLTSADPNKIAELKTQNRVNRFLLNNVNKETRSYLIENPIVLANLTKVISQTISEVKNYFPDSKVFADQVGRSLQIQGQYNLWEGNTKYHRELSTNDIVHAVLAINDYTDIPYDGVIFRNITDSGSTTAINVLSDIIALFDSNQFKLIGNENPTLEKDMRFSLGANDFDVLDEQVEKQFIEDEQSKVIGSDLGDLNGIALNEIGTQQLYEEALALKESNVLNDLVNASRRLQEIVRRYRYMDNTGEPFYSLTEDVFEAHPELEEIMGLVNEIASKFPKDFSSKKQDWDVYKANNLDEINSIKDNWAKQRDLSSFEVKDGETPTVILVAGNPGAGKSTALKGKNALQFDIDDVMFEDPTFKQYGGVSSGSLHDKAGIITKEIINELYGDENVTVDDLRKQGKPVYNIAFPKIFGESKNGVSDPTRLQSFIDKAKRKGYKVIVNLVDITNDQSRVRNTSRFAEDLGRAIPDEIIKGYGDHAYNNFISALEKEENNDVEFHRYESGSEVDVYRTRGERVRDTLGSKGNGRERMGQTSLPPTGREDSAILSRTREGNQGVVSEDVDLGLQLNEQDGSFFDGNDDTKYSLGADNSDIQEGLDANAEAVEQYGAYDYGRNPTRNLDIAKRTDAGPTSRFWNNLANSEYVSDEEAQKIQARIGKGLGTYEQTTNKEQRTKARQMIRKEGLENSLRYMLEGNTNTATDIMFGKELLSEMTEKGLTGSDEYYQLQENLAYRATMAGQALQAYNTFRTQTPQGQIITITSEIERIQQALNERFGEGAYDVQLNEGLIEEYLRATTQEERDNIRLKLAVDIAEQIPPTLMEQLNSWRHVSMLFNPRTWIKNASANFVHGYINEITRAMRSVAEGVAQKIDPNIQRQAGTYNPFSSQDKANYEKAIKDYNENFTGNISKYNNYDIFGGLTSTDFGRQVMDNRKQFTWNFLNNISDLNARMMSDRPAVSKAYAKTLVGYLKVNNLTFETITPEQMRQAREFAMKEALYATFNSDNWLANQITAFERQADKVNPRVGAMTRMIVESFIPFKRTPFNILKTGINYSPVGLAKTLSLNLLDLKNNKITANTFIDNLCQGLTGSGIMLLGALLSNLGIFRTKDEDKDRKKYFDQDNGEQDYSINFGNRSYTIDWLDPLIIPLSMGAEMQKLMADGRLSLNDLSALATAMMEPLFETSMMSGITKNLKSYADDSTGYTTDILDNAMKNYASQYIPSIMGALARTVDDTRRSTYTSKEEESVFNNEFIKQIKNKIPGLSMTNEPYVNKQGQEQKNEDLGIGMVGRAVLNFLSPGYYAEKELDKYDEELYRLYEDTGELDALPSNNTKNFTFEKEDYELSAEEYTAWHKTRWQTEAKYVNEFIDSKAYQNLTDEERVKTIKDIRSYAQKVAKKEFLNSRGIEYEGDKQLRQAQGAMDSGIDLYSYFDYLNNAGTKQAEKVKYLEESDLTKKQKEYLWDMNDYKKSYEDVYKKVFSETGDDSSSKKKSSGGSKNESSGNTSRVSGSGGRKKSTGRTSKGKSTKAKSVKTSDATVSKSTNIANKFLNAYSSTLKNVKESSNASATTQSVKVCPKCGNRFHSSSGICPICGTKV